MAKILREALKANFKKPLFHAYYLAIYKARSSVKWVCVLRVVEHLPLLFSIQLSKIKSRIAALAYPLANFKVRKHTFKASVACNGR